MCHMSHFKRHISHVMCHLFSTKCRSYLVEGLLSTWPICFETGLWKFVYLLQNKITSLGPLGIMLMLMVDWHSPDWGFISIYQDVLGYGRVGGAGLQVEQDMLEMNDSKSHQLDTSPWVVDIWRLGGWFFTDRYHTFRVDIENLNSLCITYFTI